MVKSTERSFVHAVMETVPRMPLEITMRTSTAGGGGSGRTDGAVDTRTVYARTVDVPGVDAPDVDVDVGGVRSPLMEFVDTEGAE